ncbi:RNA polymerase II elongation factor ELL2-like protein, partial [Euroglyphus maynei]
MKMIIKYFRLIITIPNHIDDDDDDDDDDYDKKAQCFNFSIKDIQNDGGILECVRQTSMSMESLGKIMLRMQIHANDDVYQKTKVKMAVAAEQESKKYNTKVIELSGRKVKAKKPYTTNGGKFTGSNNKTATKNSLVRFNKFTNGNNSNGQSKSIPGEHLRKVRELLIQLLVTKSCNKPVELIPKVQERFKELPIDKQQIIQILNTIATFKEGIYQLNELAVAEEALQQFETEKRNGTTNVSITLNGGNINNNNSSISPFSDHSARSITSPNSLNTSPTTTTTIHKHSPYPNGTAAKPSMKRGGPDFFATNISTTGQKKFK